jgi:hypothetical protein
LPRKKKKPAPRAFSLALVHGAAGFAQLLESMQEKTP